MAVVSVSIDSIAAGGDGVGRSNGLVVFVPRTAPGDVVTAQSTIETIKTLGRNVVMTTRTEVRTVAGEQVCTAYSTLVERGTAGEAE